MTCNRIWVSADGTRKPVHDLEDSHIVNIIRYLTYENLMSMLKEELTPYLQARYKETIAAIEEEAIRRGMDLEEIYSSLDHPPVSKDKVT